MFTNEFALDHTITTILDDFAIHEDVRLIIDDSCVYIQQWDEVKESYKTIVFSHKMFHELQQAMRQPEGIFSLK
jgi:hypothetical protein